MYRCYVTRTSLQCVSPGLSYGKVDSGPAGNGPTWGCNDDTRVCFQYSGIDSVPQAKRLNNEDLYKQLEKDLKEYGAQDVKVGHQFKSQLAAALSADAFVGSSVLFKWTTLALGVTERSCNLMLV